MGRSTVKPAADFVPAEDAELNGDGAEPAFISQLRGLAAAMPASPGDLESCVQYVYRFTGANTTGPRELVRRNDADHLFQDLHDVGLAFGPGFYGVSTLWRESAGAPQRSHFFSGRVGKEYGPEPDPAFAPPPGAPVGFSLETSIEALDRLAAVAGKLRGEAPPAPSPSSIAAAAEKALADLVTFQAKLSRAKMERDDAADNAEDEGEDAPASAAPDWLGPLVEKLVPQLLDSVLKPKGGAE